jgi:hypothetical protein
MQLPTTTSRAILLVLHLPAPESKYPRAKAYPFKYSEQSNKMIVDATICVCVCVCDVKGHVQRVHAS